MTTQESALTSTLNRVRSSSCMSPQTAHGPSLKSGLLIVSFLYPSSRTAGGSAHRTARGTGGRTASSTSSSRATPSTRGTSSSSRSPRASGPTGTRTPFPWRSSPTRPSGRATSAYTRAARSGATLGSLGSCGRLSRWSCSRASSRRAALEQHVCP